jgi:hypothetical protein
MVSFSIPLSILVGGFQIKIHRFKLNTLSMLLIKIVNEVNMLMLLYATYTDHILEFVINVFVCLNLGIP